MPPHSKSRSSVKPQHYTLQVWCNTPGHTHPPQVLRSHLLPVAAGGRLPSCQHLLGFIFIQAALLEALLEGLDLLLLILLQRRRGLTVVGAAPEAPPAPPLSLPASSSPFTP